MKQINSLATRLSLIVGLFFLCADFLSIVEGDADVVRSVDRQLVDESVEGIRGNSVRVSGVLLNALRKSS